MVWHSRTARRICEMLLRAGRDAEREIGVVLDGRTVRVPDVVRWRTDVAVDPDAYQVPADLIDLVVEVISPESVKRDRDRKPRDYAGAGIPSLWLAERCPDDPDDALVCIHDLTLHPGGPEYVVTRRVLLSVLEDKG
jgi:Uma2 family endonuclease